MFYQIPQDIVDLIAEFVVDKKHDRMVEEMRYFFYVWETGFIYY